jgi:hypothetical protein
MTGFLEYLRWQVADYLAEAAMATDEAERKRCIMLAAHCHVMIAEREGLGLISDAEEIRGPIAPKPDA